MSQALAHKMPVHLPLQTLGTHPALILVMFLQNAAEAQSILREDWTRWWDKLCPLHTFATSLQPLFPSPLSYKNFSVNKYGNF